MAKTKKSLKLPPVLATLGRAVEVKGQHVHFSFPAKDNVVLLAAPNGKTLYCIQIEKKATTGAEFLDIWEKHKTEAEKGAALYEKWNDFEVQSGSVIKKPRGFLWQVDRCHMIVYESDKWSGKKHKYIHEFKHPPLMWVNKKTAPTVLVLSGGKIRTTERGITG